MSGLIRGRCILHFIYLQAKGVYVKGSGGVHHGELELLSTSKVLQLLFAVNSTWTVSVPHVFKECAHLFGAARVPKAGIVAPRSHLYQMSVKVCVQNCVSAALLVSRH